MSVTRSSRRQLLSSAVGITAASLAPRPALARQTGKMKGVARDKSTLTPRVLVLNYDPIIEAEGGKRIHEVCNWNDPRYLAAGYAADIAACSGGQVRYQIVDWKDLDEHPIKKDGFRYTDESFLTMWRDKAHPFHQPDAFDYHAMIRDQEIEKRINSGDIDEVWQFAYPFVGTWESTMAGPTAYFCNSDPLPNVKTNRNFVIMGFNYERGVGEMLEDMGHRTESILKRLYGSWDSTHPKHDWDRFTLYDKTTPGQSACGNVHYAPNSDKDYDWGNKRYVESSADDWLDYPRLTGKKRVMNCSDWGNGYIRSHHRWWLERLPKAAGRGPNGILANWWNYSIDFNSHKESDGT